MRLKITVLEGDGIGPEVTREAVRALYASADLNGHKFEFTTGQIGGDAIKQSGTPLPRATLDMCMASDAVLLGAVGSPEFDLLPAAQRPEAGLLLLRRALGNYANLRPAIAYEAIASSSPLRPEIARDADILIVRELLGGLYFGEPRGIRDDNGNSLATNTMTYSTHEIERVARAAFDAALRRKKKVTSVDKANVLETSQLWRRVVSEVALDYPDVMLEHLYVDACAMHLITNPKRFDVIVTENLFGDILSDEAAVITGSLGMLGSASIGGEVGLYEPVHGSAPDIVGQGVANPVGAIASAAMLLRYTGKLEQEAEDIEEAIRLVLKEGYRTPDIKSPVGGVMTSTSEMGQLVIEALGEIADRRHAYHAV
ncbi:MAG: 3-isopropylmalate dehydrogenase [Alphaproteobacteria bacterium]|nr:3-isopropylmalate dehydrogenase [Alphaproteobacteria bacterium]